MWRFFDVVSRLFSRQTLKVWREITVEPKSGHEYLLELEQAGIGVVQDTKEILLSPAFKTLTNPIKIKITRKKVRDLGFKEQPTTLQILSRIQKIGGELCPPELGPMLRKQYPDQLRNEIIRMFVKQVPNEFGNFFSFRIRYLEHKKPPYLIGCYVGPTTVWDLDSDIVFVIPD